MDRRTFITLSGAVGAGLALHTLPTQSGHAVAMAPAVAVADPRVLIPEPGMYRISGVVRLDAPSVEISGIANTQSLSWGGSGAPESAVSSFMSFEHFAEAGLLPRISVRGGRLEALTAVLVED